MGKFGIPSLKKAEDLLSLFSSNLSKINSLRSEVSTSPPNESTLSKLDEISNLSSITSDTSQAISELFPSKSWKSISFDVQDKMIDVFTDLNHDPLFSNTLETLKKDHWSSLSPSHQYFTSSLIRDLSKESMGSSEDSLQIHRLQSQFLQNIRSSHSKLEVSIDELDSIPSQLRPDRPGDKFEDITTINFNKSSILQTLTYCSSPSLRPKLFQALSGLAEENYSVLDELIQNRHRSSQSLGFENFSHFALAHQSFPTQPKALIERLETCFTLLQGKLLNEYAVLLDRKALEEQKSRKNPVSLHPSDIAYYLQKYLNMKMVEKFPTYSSYHFAENYFTVFNVLEGVKALLEVQFGLQGDFVMCPSEETWSNDIVKGTLKKQGAVVGVIYFDLFQRPGKSSAPAKFNIICGRGASKYFKEKQVPVVVLSTSFPKNASDSLHVTMEDLKMKGMNFAMLQEFYHELGHSLHSISCSNEFQTYSGTRVPVDLAEIPSHVFEHFVTDFQFVKTWAVHKNSKELLEEGYFQYLLGRSQEFPALQRHMQLGVALFDLYLHSSPCLEKAVQMFETRHKSQEFQGNWFCSVEHFVEYGSCYYSYILDEAISNVIWETVYNKKTFNGNAGKVFFDQLLSQGGSIDPQKQINNLLKPFLIEDQSDSQDVDPFYLMEFWFKKFFADSQLVSLDKLRAENRVFYK